MSSRQGDVWTTEVVSTQAEHSGGNSASAVAFAADVGPVTAFWYGGMYGSIDVRWKRLPDGVDNDCDGTVDDVEAP